MNERATQRLLAPLARRLQNLVARGVVVLSDASRKLQTLQIKLLADEVADGSEHFEPYGYTARPHPGAEHVTIFVDGDRSHPLTIVVADRRYRLTALAEGEVAIYDDQGQKVHLTRTGIVVDAGGKAITFQNATSVAFNGVGSITHDGVNIGKTHRHPAGTPNTGTPV
jgi:phage baseplate assembly protein V